MNVMKNSNTKLKAKITKEAKTDLIEEYLDLQLNKSIHVIMPSGIHRSFKSAASSHGLSMQEIFQNVALLLVEGSSDMRHIVENIKLNKIRGKSVKDVKVGSSNIYDLLEENDVIRS
jgi:hypothetical protein